jgi:hypothetical protein
MSTRRLAILASLLILAAIVVRTVLGSVMLQGPVAPTQGLVEVANQSGSPATFAWQSPGLFGAPLLGASGTEPIDACSLYARGFGPGDQRITVHSSSDASTFTFVVPATGQLTISLVIGADGTVARTTERALPTSSACPGSPAPSP